MTQHPCSWLEGAYCIALARVFVWIREEKRTSDSLGRWPTSTIIGNSIMEIQHDRIPQRIATSTSLYIIAASGSCDLRWRVFSTGTCFTVRTFPSSCEISNSIIYSGKAKALSSRCHSFIINQKIRGRTATMCREGTVCLRMVPGSRAMSPPILPIFNFR